MSLAKSRARREEEKKEEEEEASNSAPPPVQDIEKQDCNIRFIKGHKPSNHICARIKSHIYTTE